jgi:hypothetical protein
MKRLLVAGVLVAALAGLARADEPGFAQSITPEEAKAAGLDKLTPAEISRLDELVKAYRNGAVDTARRKAEEALVAQQAAEAQVRAAEEKARAAEDKIRAADEKSRAAEEKSKAAEVETKAAKAEVVELKKSDFGFFSRAKILIMPGTKVEYAEIRTTIAGSFEGWDNRTIFHLANGQAWQVANGGQYYMRPTENMEVVITQSALGGFWMRFPSIDEQVRVRLLGER